jgi:hypothetical protein
LADQLQQQVRWDGAHSVAAGLSCVAQHTREISANSSNCLWRTRWCVWACLALAPAAWQCVCLGEQAVSCVSAE